MNAVVQSVVYTLAPLGATITGGVIAAFRPPGEKFRSYIQHFAAGVVTAAIAVEVLPPVKEQTPWSTVAGGMVGMILMLGLTWCTRRLEARQQNAVQSVSIGLLATTALDIFIDGVLIGAGISASAKQGLLLTIALTLELLFLGLSVAATFSGLSRWASIAITSGLGLLVSAGAASGVAALSGVSKSTLAAVLAFGSIALLYLVTEELLVEAHENKQEPLLGAASLFSGFLIYLVIAELVE